MPVGSMEEMCAIVLYHIYIYIMNIYPIRSMGLVIYLDLPDFYGKCRCVYIYIPCIDAIGMNSMSLKNEKGCYLC